MTSATAGSAWLPFFSFYPGTGATISAYGASYTGDGTSGIEVYAAQLQHNFDGDYVPTTDAPITQYDSPLLTAAANELAYQHNSQGECVGLLQYPADTNLILQSQNLGTTWTGTGIAVSLTKRLWAGSAPFWRISKTDTATSRALNQVLTVSLAAGTKHTASIVLLGDRWSNTNSVRVGVFGLDNSTWGSNSDSSAVIISGPGTLMQDTGAAFNVTGLSYDIPTLIRITRTYPLAETRTGVYIYPGTAASTILGAAILATRVHLSASPRYMPYIPTTTAAVTRGAQSITLSGSAFAAVNNPVGGTLLARANVEDAVFDVTRVMVQLQTGTAITTGHRIAIASAGTTAQVQAATFAFGSVQTTDTDIGTISATPQTIAYSFANNSFTPAMDGKVEATRTLGIVPVVDRLQIGWGASTGNTRDPAYLIQRTELYPRAMTSAELAALTTPGVII